MAGLVTASRVYPTCGASYMRNSGKRELRAIHVFIIARKQDVDARAKPGHDESNMGSGPHTTPSVEYSICR